MDLVNERIGEYTSKDDFEPCEVVFELDAPLYITSPFIHFDSILKYLCLRDALNDLFYVLPTDFVFDVSNLSIPLKMTEGVYHSSVSIFDEAKLYKETIYKRFTDKEVGVVNDKRLKKIRVGSGYYKGFMINLPALLSTTVTFYCNGDKKELERLLPHLTHLGKKTSIGGGHIRSFKVKSTECDYSFFKDGEVMRPIPAKIGLEKFHIPLTEGRVIQKQAYKPPYWDKKNVSICYMPNSQISTIGV